MQAVLDVSAAWRRHSAAPRGADACKSLADARSHPTAPLWLLTTNPSSPPPRPPSDAARARAYDAAYQDRLPPSFEPASATAGRPAGMNVGEMVDRALQGPLGRFTGDSECCAAAADFFYSCTTGGGSGGAGSPSPVLDPEDSDFKLWETLPGFIEGPAESGLFARSRSCFFDFFAADCALEN